MCTWVRAEVTDARKGRSAVAARAVSAGTRVLSTSPFAYAAALSACSWCLSAAETSAPLSRCGGCRRARYCSRRCQQADWAAGKHRLECSAWRETIPVGIKQPQTLILAARAAARLYLPPPSSSSPEDAAQVEQLRHHQEDHSPEKLAQFREMAQLVLLLLARSKFTADGTTAEHLGVELMDRVVRLFCRVECNAFTICDDANARVGVGLFPRGALFNHSCSPNCVVSFRGRDLVVHAVRDVLPGEELTISYVELLMATNKRRRALHESYFFDCDCSRCTSALHGESSDDAFLTGLACPASGCNDGVIVTEDPNSSPRQALQCQVCGKHRDSSDVTVSRQRLSDIRRALAEAQQRAGCAALEQWGLHQQLWEVVRCRLRAHPKSTLVAKTARDIGNFLMDTDVTALAKPGEQPPRALPFFLDELHATEWVIPDVHLPSRGLLHFQIAKLIVQDVEQRRGVGQHESVTMMLIDDADRHIKDALLMYVAFHTQRVIFRWTD